jgi:hypothetical protein
MSRVQEFSALQDSCEGPVRGALTLGCFGCQRVCEIGPDVARPDTDRSGTCVSRRRRTTPRFSLRQSNDRRSQAFTPHAFRHCPFVRTKPGSSVHEPDPHSPSPPNQHPDMPKVRPTQAGPRHGSAADLVLPTVPARRLRGAPRRRPRSHRHSAGRARIPEPRHQRVRRPDPALPRRLPTSPRRTHRPRGRAETQVQPRMAVDPQGNRRTHRRPVHASPAGPRTLRGDSLHPVGSMNRSGIGRTGRLKTASFRPE